MLMVGWANPRPNGGEKVNIADVPKCRNAWTNCEVRREGSGLWLQCCNAVASQSLVPYSLTFHPVSTYIQDNRLGLVPLVSTGRNAWKVPRPARDDFQGTFLVRWWWFWHRATA
jgi:hypothetical protein